MNYSIRYRRHRWVGRYQLGMYQKIIVVIFAPYFTFSTFAKIVLFTTNRANEINVSLVTHKYE
jgi:hypothetical protein